ncbi:formate dehydrogenase accessory sulfurtransferase FdhD [Desulfosarcina sp. OttesenSCG-928-G10]|nr:formate dehydrogenase accessory sulfurtransferase FdhD [Desulfosarcina sp. OttesenSCG-928-G10]
MDTHLKTVTFQQPIRILENAQARSEVLTLIGEAPLFIRIQEVPLATILRTPGSEKAHAAGFCLGEGLVDAPGDIADITVQHQDDGACRADIKLSPGQYARLTDPKAPHPVFSPARQQADPPEARQLSPVPDTPRVSAEDAKARLLGLDAIQPLRQKTRASHGAAIYDPGLGLLSVAEDVGRHNALDKAIGDIFLNGTLSRAHLLTLSSRISAELVQKAARARIPLILAISRPTALAVHMADALNITLASLGKDDRLYVYCRPDRLV